MPPLPEPPDAYKAFVARHPKLGQAWDLTREGSDGPLDKKAARLVKLGIACGAMRQGAVHSAVKKALAAGASRPEIDQVVALAASTLGFPSTVAIFTWIEDVLSKKS